MDYVEMQLAEQDGVALMTWVADLPSAAPPLEELRVRLAQPGSNLSTSETFVLASHAVSHSLATGGLGRALVMAEIRGEERVPFALRIDTTAGEACVPVDKPDALPDAGVATDGGVERDAGVEAGVVGHGMDAGRDAGMVHAADASTGIPAVPPVTRRDGGDEDTGPRVGRRARDSGCSVPNSLRSSSGDARLLSLLLVAVVAHRMRRRRKAR